MSFFETLKNFFQQPGVAFAHVPIPATRVHDANFERRAIAPEAGYFRIWLADMGLENRRAWFTDWHPAVHSVVHYEYANKVDEHPHFASPVQLKGFDSTNLGAVGSLNHKMTPTIPFLGGTVELNAGLVGLKGDSLLGSFIGALAEIASLTGQQELTSGMTVASKINDVLGSLLGPKEDHIHVGFHQTFTAEGVANNRLESGYIAVVGVPKAKLPADLSVHEGRLRVGADARKLFAGENFMLLRIEVTDDRDDWEYLTSIREPWDRMVEALIDGKSDLGRSYFSQAVIAARNSRDLIKAHRIRAQRALKDEYDSWQNAAPGFTGDRSFSELMGPSGLSSAQLLADGEPSLAELLDS